MMSLFDAIIFVLVIPSACAVLNDNFVVFVEGIHNQIWQISDNGSQLTLLLEDPAISPIGIDYDPVNRKIYFTDVLNYVISRMNLDGSNVETVIKLTPASEPEGIAVDPIAGLLFYADSTQNTINLATIDGGKHKTLVTNVKSPRGLKVNPLSRRLYWSDWGIGAIESCQYDGEDRRVIVDYRSETWLNGIDVSAFDDTIYWTDRTSKSIMSSDEDGGNIREMHTGALVVGNKTIESLSYYDVAVDSENIYFTDWDSGYLYKSAKDGGTVQIIASMTSLATIIAYNSSFHPIGAESDCNTNNGGCSDICIPLLVEPVCTCPDFYRLSNDEKTCTEDMQANGPDVIWIEHDSYHTSYIRGLEGKPLDYLRTKQMMMWTVKTPSWHWSAIDMNYEDNLLYLADKEDRYIVQMSLNGNIVIKVISTGISAEVSGIAVDWVSGNVYWTDATYNWIKVVKAEEMSPFQKTLISTGLDSPHGIAVWPQKGLMVWSDWGSVPKIEFSKLNGEGRSLLWEKDLNQPKGVSIDYTSNRVFWCSKTSINSVAFDGKSATDYKFHGGYSGVNFVDFTLYLDYIIAVDVGARGVPKMWFYNRKEDASQGRHLSLDRSPNGVVMYDDSCQEAVGSECSSLKCDQLCLSTGDGRSQCACSDGYELQDDKRSCASLKDIVKSPTYVYSLGDRICAVEIKNSLSPSANPNYLCFFENSDNNFYALDYDFLAGEIYFSETKSRVRSIRKSHIITKDNNSAIIHGVGIVKGISVDWTANNIYWTDSKHGHIWMARTDGTYQKLVAKNAENPHGIAADLIRKKLFWSEIGKGGILTSDLQGKSAALVYSRDSFQPGSMTIDYRDSKLYVIDTSTNNVYSLDLDNYAFKEELNIGTEYKSVSGVASFQDYLILTVTKSSNSSGIVIYNKLTKEPAMDGILHGNTTNAYDVIPFVDQHYSSFAGTNDCKLNNGGCEQLCIQNTVSYSCICVDGFILNADLKTCSSGPLLTDNFFLMADDYRNQIYQADRTMTDIRAVKNPKTDRPIALSYDFLEDRVYWTDFTENVVKRSFLNGSDSVIIRFKDNNSRIDGLAFEPISRLVYFTDTGRHEIGIMNPTGINRKVLVRGSSVIPSPRAIALDPENGHMYYTVRETRNGKIERRNMDGTSVMVLVGTLLSSPSGLSLDLSARKMYWCDAGTENVEAAGMDGSSRQTLVTLSADSDPFGIATQGNFIYWTDWNYRGIHRSLLSGKEVSTLHSDFFTGLNDIHYFSRSALPDKTSCSENNGGCSHFCIPLPNQMRVCECPDTYEGAVQKTVNGLNCARVDTCDDTIPNGAWEGQCSMQVGESCTFTCYSGYGSTTSNAIRCGRDRKWEAKLEDFCTDKTCPFLLTPLNAVADENCQGVVGPGMQCIHQCRTGYVQKGGDQIRNCGQDLQWTGHPIICIARDACDPLPAPANAISNPPDCSSEPQEVGSTCVHLCRNGYKMVHGIGTYQRVCTNTGAWAGSDIYCKIIDPGSQPSTHHDNSLKIPVLAGIMAAIIVFLVLIIAILCFLWRKRTAKNRRQQNQQPPSYDVHRDLVTINCQTPAFDNPVYTSHTDIQNIRNEAAAAIPTQPDPDKIPPMDEKDEACALPDKLPLDFDNVNLIDDDDEVFGMKNPGYKANSDEHSHL